MKEKYHQPCEFGFDLVLSSCLIQRSFKVNPECFWQPLSSALNSFVMGQKGQDLKREKGGIKQLSEGKKDFLMKLVDVSVQESFSFSYDHR